MKISDVLWKAANEYLRNTGRTGEIYSCFAVLRAEGNAIYCPALTFLEELGCDPNGDCLFGEFETNKERQGARYLWLMFAYLVALDEGL